MGCGGQIQTFFMGFIDVSSVKDIMCDPDVWLMFFKITPKSLRLLLLIVKSSVYAIINVLSVSISLAVTVLKSVVSYFYIGVC